MPAPTMEMTTAAIGMAIVRLRENSVKARLGCTTRARGGLTGAVPACLCLVNGDGNKLPTKTTRTWLGHGMEKPAVKVRRKEEASIGRSWLTAQLTAAAAQNSPD